MEWWNGCFGGGVGGGVERLGKGAEGWGYGMMEAEAKADMKTR